LAVRLFWANRRSIAEKNICYFTENTHSVDAKAPFLYRLGKLFSNVRVHHVPVLRNRLETSSNAVPYSLYLSNCATGVISTHYPLRTHIRASTVYRPRPFPSTPLPHPRYRILARRVHQRPVLGLFAPTCFFPGCLFLIDPFAPVLRASVSARCSLSKVV